MPGKPTAHGVQDVWLDGGMHLAADREAAARIAKQWPSVPVLVNAAHDFHVRAAVWCAERGITGFARLGTAGYLPGRSLSGAVRRVRPDARLAVTIPHPDPYVLASGLAAAIPGVDVVQAAGTDPDAVLSAGPIAEMMTVGAVCLIFGLIAQFHRPRRFAQITERYAAALPPGSFIVMSAMVTADPGEAAGFRRAYPQRVYPWTAADVRRALGGLELVPPGVAEVQEWPEAVSWAGPPLEGAIPVRVAGAVARKR